MSDAPAQTETSAPPAPPQDDLGLSIDMLDVDRLREWARLLLIHGADISHWASVPHVASKLQTLATGIEHAVRDIGTLRQHIEGLTRQLENVKRSRDALYKAFCEMERERDDLLRGRTE